MAGLWNNNPTKGGGGEGEMNFECLVFDLDNHYFPGFLVLLLVLASNVF